MIFLDFHQTERKHLSQCKICLDTVISTFRQSCEADKSSYEHFLALLSKKQYLLAQIFAQQKMSETPKISKKTKQHLRSNEGAEVIFLKKIIFYMDFLDSESPELDQKFFDHSVREIIVESAETTNFLADLNVGLRDPVGQTPPEAEEAIRSMLKMLDPSSSNNRFLLGLDTHNFFPELPFLNAEKFLAQLEEINKRVQRLKKGNFEDSLTQQFIAKKGAQSGLQKKFITSITDPDVLRNRTRCCQAHHNYMLEFFTWAVPVYKSLQQQYEALQALRTAAAQSGPPDSASPQKRDKLTVVVETEAPSSAPPPPELCALPAGPTIETIALPVWSDHANLPPAYWTGEETDPQHVANFWDTWTRESQSQAPALVEADDERARAQQAFVQEFMVDKQPSFFKALNELRRLFDVKIVRSINGFAKLEFPQNSQINDTFHVPHSKSDIGRDAMWARHIRKFLVEMGFRGAE